MSEWDRVKEAYYEAADERAERMVEPDHVQCIWWNVELGERTVRVFDNDGRNPITAALVGVDVSDVDQWGIRTETRCRMNLQSNDTTRWVLEERRVDACPQWWVSGTVAGEPVRVHPDGHDELEFNDYDLWFVAKAFSSDDPQWAFDNFADFQELHTCDIHGSTAPDGVCRVCGPQCVEPGCDNPQLGYEPDPGLCDDHLFLAHPTAGMHPITSPYADEQAFLDSVGW